MERFTQEDKDTIKDNLTKWDDILTDVNDVDENYEILEEAIKNIQQAEAKTAIDTIKKEINSINNHLEHDRGKTGELVSKAIELIEDKIKELEDALVEKEEEIRTLTEKTKEEQQELQKEVKQAINKRYKIQEFLPQDETISKHLENAWSSIEELEKLTDQLRIRLMWWLEVSSTTAYNITTWLSLYLLELYATDEDIINWIAWLLDKDQNIFSLLDSDNDSQRGILSALQWAQGKIWLKTITAISWILWFFKILNDESIAKEIYDKTSSIWAHPILHNSLTLKKTIQKYVTWDKNTRDEDIKKLFTKAPTAHDFIIDDWEKSKLQDALSWFNEENATSLASVIEAWSWLDEKMTNLKEDLIQRQGLRKIIEKWKMLKNTVWNFFNKNWETWKLRGFFNKIFRFIWFEWIDGYLKECTFKHEIGPIITEYKEQSSNKANPTLQSFVDNHSIVLWNTQKWISTIAQTLDTTALSQAIKAKTGKKPSKDNLLSYMPTSTNQDGTEAIQEPYNSYVYDQLFETACWVILSWLAEQRTIHISKNPSPHEKEKILSHLSFYLLDPTSSKDIPTDKIRSEARTEETNAWPSVQETENTQQETDPDEENTQTEENIEESWGVDTDTPSSNSKEEEPKPTTPPTQKTTATATTYTIDQERKKRPRYLQKPKKITWEVRYQNDYGQCSRETKRNLAKLTNESRHNIPQDHAKNLLQKEENNLEKISKETDNIRIKLLERKEETWATIFDCYATTVSGHRFMMYLDKHDKARVLDASHTVRPYARNDSTPLHEYMTHMKKFKWRNNDGIILYVHKKPYYPKQKKEVRQAVKVDKEKNITNKNICLDCVPTEAFIAGISSVESWWTYNIVNRWKNGKNFSTAIWKYQHLRSQRWSKIKSYIDATWEVLIKKGSTERKEAWYEIQKNPVLLRKCNWKYNKDLGYIVTYLMKPEIQEGYMRSYIENDLAWEAKVAMKNKNAQNYHAAEVMALCHFLWRPQAIKFLNSWRKSLWQKTKNANIWAQKYLWIFTTKYNQKITKEFNETKYRIT